MFTWAYSWKGCYHTFHGTFGINFTPELITDDHLIPRIRDPHLGLEIHSLLSGRLTISTPIIATNHSGNLFTTVSHLGGLRLDVHVKLERPSLYDVLLALIYITL